MFRITSTALGVVAGSACWVTIRQKVSKSPLSAVSHAGRVSISSDLLCIWLPPRLTEDCPRISWRDSRKSPQKHLSNMTSRFTVKEIAHQAGLSLATVDRVLHGRAHVRDATRDRVRAAVDELERQYALTSLTGTRITLDVVMQAPDRFSSAVRAAFEAE